MARNLGIWAAVTGAVALVGVPVGLLWTRLADRPLYLVVDQRPHLLDPESETLITADGRFALLAVGAGVLTGLLAYWRGGRGADLSLVLGLFTGGVLGALLAWWLGHRFGLTAFTEAVATGADGTRVRAPLDLGARGVLTLWPLAAVAVFGVLEAIDAARRLPAADRGEPGPGEPDEVGGGEFDLQAAPPGRDVDGRER
ncbi:hypothetical protein LO762_16755 [Actinocorallia sp. API 0066]|uniref:hypothetical protein n=1 Tax=Actinocorallia sp. API 0066 TaxID=2896846 RepID=UPI001E64AD44|nr:hypothetical protein [Actinocorallia sp. API 0066]MCD0450830.1 hypothetical protein [Actinocorallia sp. API 0066]